jgi:hypothetical protein
MKSLIDWFRRAWGEPAATPDGFGAQLDRAVDEHGWTAVYVGDYRSAPTWTYTTGFHETLGQPEVIIVDIPQESANRLLWDVFEQLRDQRLRLQDGKVWPEDSERPGVWRQVHRTQLESADGWFTFAMVRSLARGGTPFDFDAFQLVLPDNEGRLPWEAGYDETLRPRQPTLYLPHAEG